MKRLSEVTRRDLFDIIRDGFVINKDELEYHPDFKEPMIRTVSEEVSMPFYGRLTEIDFLSRLYDLDNMPSSDPRFKNARGDIGMHTINNDDWDEFWFFSDARFKLSHGNDDEYILKFISEMLHPAVRKETSSWKKYLVKFNQILLPDGYELRGVMSISGREVYDAIQVDSIEIKNIPEAYYASMKLIGEGSYAKVYKFKDENYNKYFALKRARKDLDPKEIERFKREYSEMKRLNSLHIVEVYFYNEEKDEYIMEYMDCTLEKYIHDNNSTISMHERRNIILQLIRGYQYLHSQGIYHRDVSMKNALVKKYDDINIYKISDFGLVKKAESELTSINTEIKGSLNDPTLKVKGFSHYELLDEIYALTLLFVFIITGKTNFSSVTHPTLKTFMEIGTHADRTKRYQDLVELKNGALTCIESLS